MQGGQSVVMRVRMRLCRSVSLVALRVTDSRDRAVLWQWSLTGPLVNCRDPPVGRGLSLFPRQASEKSEILKIK